MSKNILKGLFVVFSTALLLLMTACEDASTASAQSPGVAEDISEVNGEEGLPKLEMPPMSPVVNG